MKKIILLLLIIVLAGCSSDDTDEESQPKQINQSSHKIIEVEEKVTNESRFNEIDEIIIPDQTEWLSGLQAYEDFNMEVIKHIGERYDIPVKVKKVATFEDSIMYLNDNKIDVVLGMSKSDGIDIKTTYTYLSTALYLPNGVEVEPRTSYKFGVRHEDKVLLEMLNEAIDEMNESGELKELEEKHFAERNSKEHVTLDEISTISYLETLNSSEREQLQKELDQYMEPTD